MVGLSDLGGPVRASSPGQGPHLQELGVWEEGCSGGQGTGPPGELMAVGARLASREGGRGSVVAAKSGAQGPRDVVGAACARGSQTGPLCGQVRTGSCRRQSPDDSLLSSALPLASATRAPGLWEPFAHRQRRWAFFRVSVAGLEGAGGRQVWARDLSPMLSTQPSPRPHTCRLLSLCHTRKLRHGEASRWPVPPANPHGAGLQIGHQAPALGSAATAREPGR